MPWRASLIVAVVTLAVLGGGGLAYLALQQKEAERKAAMLTGGNPGRAPDLMRTYGCGGCHQIPGITGARGRIGPPLQGVAQRVYVGGVLPNTPENLVKWIVRPRAHNPRTAMPVTGSDETGARDIAAYLYARS
jgi:cytochrome c2